MRPVGNHHRPSRVSNSYLLEGFGETKSKYDMLNSRMQTCICTLPKIAITSHVGRVWVHGNFGPTDQKTPKSFPGRCAGGEQSFSGVDGMCKFGLGI